MLASFPVIISYCLTLVFCSLKMWEMIVTNEAITRMILRTIFTFKYYVFNYKQMPEFIENIKILFPISNHHILLQIINISHISSRFLNFVQTGLKGYNCKPAQ